MVPYWCCDCETVDIVVYVTLDSVKFIWRTWFVATCRLWFLVSVSDVFDLLS